MKYFEIEFTLTPCSQDAQDILAALAGEAGCETFEETATGLKAYIQQQLYIPQAIESITEDFPFDNINILYKVREAEDRDWNEQWEQEGFEPIVMDSIVIHDGRHKPKDLSPNSKLMIEIDAHLAFGTGTHETTRMICATLSDMELTGKQVLDCGSGTGILGICALKLGAAHCTSYDIDEWSTDNTRHNAVINHVDDRLTALHGDATLLDEVIPSHAPGGFGLVLANINRNILLQDMPRFRQVMTTKATLIISGFYQNDCVLLESKAQQLGLTLDSIRHDGDWACMVFHS